MRLLLFALTAFTLASVVLADDPKISLGLQPSATYPYKEVEGHIFFSVQKTGSKERLPIRRCALFHGYGVSEFLLQKLYRSTSVVGRGLRISLNLADLRTPTQGLANLYFGGPFLIDWLARDVCEEVYTLFQESAQSTLGEMIARSESFLANHVCSSDPDLVAGQKPCAIVGHSKGGALVTSIARRCMQRTSKMGQAACQNLKEVYSQSGSIQGVGLTAILLGVMQGTSENGIQKLLGDSFHAIAPPFNRRTAKELDPEVDHQLDLFSKHLPGTTNPAWWDMSPLAPVEPAMSIFEAHSTTLIRSGWWTGEYAASGGGFNSLNEDISQLACGTQWKIDANYREKIENEFRRVGAPYLADRIRYVIDRKSIRTYTGEAVTDQLCKRFTELSVLAHDSDSKLYFERGKKAFALVHKEMYPGLKPDFLREMTWESFNFSDGLVEARSALNFCIRGMKADRNRSVRSCRLFDGKSAMTPALNHYGLAGASLEAVDHIVEQLSVFE